MFLRSSRANEKWIGFVKEYLLQDNRPLLSGVCMSTKQGIPVLHYGELSQLQQEDMKYFLALFNPKPKDKEGVNEIELPRTNFKFKIVHRTFRSMYGTACDKNGTGLLINNLPQGVLVCIYHYPVSMEDAVKSVETFCDRLCA